MLLLLAATLASTTTFVVNTTATNDDGVCDATHCSLVESFRLSAGLNDDIVILVEPPGGGVIDGELTLSGGGRFGNVTIDATGADGFAPHEPVVELDGVLRVHHDGDGASFTVSLRGLAFTGDTGVELISGANVNYDLRDCRVGMGIDGLVVEGATGIFLQTTSGDVSATRVDIVGRRRDTGNALDFFGVGNASFSDVNVGVAGGVVEGNGNVMHPDSTFASLSWSGGALVAATESIVLGVGNTGAVAFSNLSIGALADGSAAGNAGPVFSGSAASFSLSDVTVVNSAGIGLSGSFTATHSFVGALPDGTAAPNHGSGVDGSLACDGCVIAHNEGSGVEALVGDDNIVSDNAGIGVGSLAGDDNLVTANGLGANAISGNRNLIVANGAGVNVSTVGSDHVITDNVPGDGLGGTLACTGCVVERNGGRGFIGGGAGSFCTDCRIADNGGEGLFTNGGDLVCTGCEIAGNGRDGIHSVSGRATCNGCDVHDNVGDGLHSSNRLNCTDCDLRDNVGAGLRADTSSGVEASCSRCTIVDNGVGVEVVDGADLVLADGFVGVNPDGSPGPNDGGPQIQAAHASISVANTHLRGTGEGPVVRVAACTLNVDSNSRVENGDVGIEATDGSFSLAATVCNVGTGYLVVGSPLELDGRMANEPGCDGRALDVGVDATSNDVSSSGLVVDAGVSAVVLRNSGHTTVALSGLDLSAPFAFSADGFVGGSVTLGGKARGRVELANVTLDEIQVGSASEPFAVRDATGVGFSLNALSPLTNLAVSADGCSGRGIDIDLNTLGGGGAGPNSSAFLVLNATNNDADGVGILVKADVVSLSGSAGGNLGRGFDLDVGPGPLRGELALSDLVLIDNGDDGLRLLGSGSGTLKGVSAFGNGGAGLRVGGAIDLDVGAADIGDVNDAGLGLTAANVGAGIVVGEDASVVLGLDRRLRRRELPDVPTRVGRNVGGGVLVEGQALVDVAPGFSSFAVPLGIDYGDDGRTPNDVGDADQAPNTPFISRIDRVADGFVVRGFVRPDANVMFFSADRNDSDAAPFSFLGEAREGSLGDVDAAVGDYDDAERGSERGVAAFAFRFSGAAAELPLGAGPLVAIASLDGRASEPSPSFVLDGCARSDDDPECDFDRDGLTTLVEATRGTSPFSADTDGDGVSDGGEGTLDFDDDGVIDALESDRHDLDLDGLSEQRDRDDVDPCVPSTLSLRCDEDGDGLSGVDEDLFGTDRRRADSDGDGLPDGIEARSDQDGDGINDALESLSLDGDGDGISDQDDREVVPFACGGLPTIRGVVTIDDDDDVAALQGTGCIVGSLVVRGGEPAGPLLLPALRFVTGVIVVEGTTVDALALPLLSQAGSIDVADNDLLLSLQLPLLGLVRGDVVVAGNPLLTSLVIEGALGNILGDLVIDDCDALTSLSLSKVQNVGGDLIITDNGALVAVSMPRLQNVGGELFVDVADGPAVCLRPGCDFDGDSILDAVERTRGTQVRDTDSDGDGRADNVEGASNLDGDLLIDALENNDTDADDDGHTAQLDADDNDACVPDAALVLCDSDADGVADGTELLRGTNPASPDSDGDGKGDALEAGTDTDGDGAIDALESDDVDNDGDGRSVERDDDDNDPCSPDPDSDACDRDDDGLSDSDERAQGTDPTASDSDLDGVADGDEPGDSDGDGAIDALESSTGDDDGDGIFDQSDRDDDDPCAPNPLAKACLDARAPPAPPRDCSGLQTVGGDIILLSDDDVAAFVATEVQCIVGNLVIGGDVTSAELARLIVVTGDVTVRDADALTSLSLPALANAGSVDVEGNTLLVEFSAPALGSVEGDLVFAGNDALTGLALPALTTIEGDVRVEDCDALADIDLPALKDVGGGLDASASGDIDLGSLESVGGDLAVSTPDGSVDVSSLDDVGGAVTIVASSITAPEGQVCGAEGCATLCGDGIKAGSEQCDDANDDDGDGCSATCTAEAGFVCTDTGCFDLDDAGPRVAATCGAGQAQSLAALAVVLLLLPRRRPRR